MLMRAFFSLLVLLGLLSTLAITAEAGSTDVATLPHIVQTEILSD